MTPARTVPRGAATPTGRESWHDPLSQVIARLDMTEAKKAWMRDRWLEQLGWFDRKAEQAHRRHTYLRVIAIAGGVSIPALVSLQGGSSTLLLWDWVQPLAIVVSLMVAAAVGLDEFFHFAERWRHFKRTAELLKTEGWLFIEGGGRYRQHSHEKDSYDRLFPSFATKVEEIIRRDVEVYLTRIVSEWHDDGDVDEREPGSKTEAANNSGPESRTESIRGSHLENMA